LAKRFLLASETTTTSNPDINIKNKVDHITQEKYPIYSDILSRSRLSFMDTQPRFAGISHALKCYFLTMSVIGGGGLSAEFDFIAIVD
jgi:hypothetical protein